VPRPEDRLLAPPFSIVAHPDDSEPFPKLLILLVLVAWWLIGAVGVRESERNKQRTRFSSSHAKMARTKDDDDEEDAEMTLNGYETPG
jgi:hypothetical protein